MRPFIKNNLPVLCVYGIALAFSLSLILNYEKVIVHIYLNQFVGNTFLNIFFYYITYLGDGLVAPFILIAIMVYNTRVGIYATLSFLTATLTSQLLKHCFFDDVNRPFFVFQWEYHYPINYVEGVERFIHNSFPSGHATQAFSIFMCLAFVTKKQSLKFLFFGIALATTISRVYLSQHWLTDITAGSFIGLLFSLIFYYVLISKNRLPQLNKPLYALKKP